VRAVPLLLLLAAPAVRAEGSAPDVLLVEITTERAGLGGTTRQTLGVPAVCVGGEGLLLIVGFALKPPAGEADESVRVEAIDAAGKRHALRVLGGDENLRCTFFRMKEGPFPAPLPLHAPELRPEDGIVLHSRHGELLSFAPRRIAATVEAVAERPQRLYAVREAVESWRGGVVTTPKGEFVGFVDARPTVGEGEGLVVGVGPTTVVVVPIDLFADLARRPPEPKGPTPRTKAWLGVNLSPFDANHEAYFGVEGDWRGAFVTGVADASPAAAAGVRVHDLLRRIGPLEFVYEKAADWPELLSKVQALPVGEAMECEFVRFHGKADGGFEPETLKATLTLGERPTDFDEASELPIEPLGIKVKPATRDWLIRSGLPLDAAGLVITSIEPGSPAQLSGLVPDDLILGVDRAPVRDAAGLGAALAAAREQNRSRVVLFIRRGGETAFVAVTPN
jgi:S1-C subfamily serine protease